MTGFALCHGWGFDAQALAPLQQALQRQFPDAAFAVFDLGFTGSSHIPRLDPGTDWIAVGHSWGFAWLVQQPVPWKAAVAINGFTRYGQRAGKEGGVTRRVVNAMLAQLPAEPRAVVEEFRRHCGAQAATPDSLDRATLQEHLERLRELEIGLPDFPILALATLDDTVVPITLARACFTRPDIVLREYAGDHMRLLHEPHIIASTIAEFAETLHA